MLEISVIYHHYKPFSSLFMGPFFVPFFLGLQCQVPWHFLTFILGNTLPQILPQRSHCPSLYHDFYVWVSQTDRHCLLHLRDRWRMEWFYLWSNSKRRDLCASVCTPQCRIRNLGHVFLWPLKIHLSINTSKRITFWMEYAVFVIVVDSKERAAVLEGKSLFWLSLVFGQDRG